MARDRALVVRGARGIVVAFIAALAAIVLTPTAAGAADITGTLKLPGGANATAASLGNLGAGVAVFEAAEGPAVGMMVGLWGVEPDGSFTIETCGAAEHCLPAGDYELIG